MQTFLPYRSFSKTMRCLDYRRLGKQRVEALQILNVLTGKSMGWRHHPAVLMWKGYEDALRMYLRCAILEWKRRGFNNHMKLPRRDRCSRRKPRWLTAAFMESHRSNLLRKEAAHYERFRWGVSPSLPYQWPISPAKSKAMTVNGRTLSATARSFRARGARRR